MQALSGLWAQQFGTPNWAAHGGFCSVNMAVAGLYTIGYSFWEFGAPDWDHAKYFMLWGVAEDHSSNPIKIGLDKLKRHGAKFVSINPVRTGYSAIADEWVPIRPGTDGLLALAIVHVLLTDGTIDFEFLGALHQRAVARRSQAPGTPDDGLFARDADGNPLVVRRSDAGVRRRRRRATSRRRCSARFDAARRPPRDDGALARRRALSRRALRAGDGGGASAASPPTTITRARARNGARRVQRGDRAADRMDRHVGPHARQVVGRPVAMYAMRGISAHSNGFQTCRALHLVQMLLGALDGPGNFRARAPYPRPHPAALAAGERSGGHLRAEHAAEAHAATAFPTRPGGSRHRRRRQAAAHRQGVSRGKRRSPRTA